MTRADLIEHVEASIIDRNLLQKGASIIVGVSGGLDSMVLLRVLNQIAPRHCWKITVAHFNHQLRGRSSDADERLVARTAKELRIPLITERDDVRKHARAQGISIEMAARELRHDFLAHSARKKRIETVALAHHLDDQVELFFLRLLRGSGTEGLSGMKWHSSSPADRLIRLLRPLLDVSKIELQQFATETGIVFREDASNECLDFERNRIRHELLPLLRRKYEPALNATLSRVMEIIGGESEFITSCALDWLRSIQTKKAKDFNELARGIQRRVIQLQLQKLGVEVDFSLVDALRLKPERRISIGGRKSAIRNLRGEIKVEVDELFKFHRGSARLDLSSPGRITFKGAHVAWTIALPSKRTTIPTKRAFEEVFDATKVGMRIVLRHWRPGDRFQPIGMTNSVKLQDFFTNEKVPRALRHKLLVATAENGEIFWVENLRISERFKLTPGTKCRLQWRWQRP